MDVGDKVGVEDANLPVVVALDGREGRVQEVVDRLMLRWINLVIQHALGPRNSIKNVGEEYVEADQLEIIWNIRNVERFLAVEHAHVL